MINKNITVSIGDAQKIILAAVKPLGPENVPIMEAYNRVLYEDVVSDLMLPPADNSSRDGYAVNADDTHRASKNNPVILRLAGEIKAGGSITGKQVLKGTAIRIMTGAPIPEGANSVVKFEDTVEENGYVKIFREIARYENYRFAGGNIKKGDRVLHQGDRLGAAGIGILASLNYNTVKVYRQPTVSIISTGDELVEIGKNKCAGQIRNDSAYTLYSEVKKYSALPNYLGIAKDTLEDTRALFLKALASDVVISTGGTSKGRYDFVKDIYEDLNIKILFQEINIKPGRPCVFGKKEHKLFFGLPGNPVATYISFIQFVRPALLSLMGSKRIKKPIVNAFLEEDINKKPGYVHLLKGYFIIKDNEFHVLTTGSQNASGPRSINGTNCLIIIPENITKVKAGEKVAIQLIEHDEI